MNETDTRPLVEFRNVSYSVQSAPKPIIDKLHEEISRIGNEPSFRQKRLIDIGIQPVFDTPEQFARYLEEQRENAARLVRDSGFQAR